MQYELKHDTSSEHFQRCLTVRKAVFVEEQGYDEEIEVDELSRRIKTDVAFQRSLSQEYVYVLNA